jgi:RHS repeat-associated protein
LTNFLYDGLNIVQEQTGTTTANLLGGLYIDERFMRSSLAETRHFLADALGSTVALADAAGNVQTSYTYDAFGGATVAGSSATNPYGYTGREDDGTGLYYYRARYLDPARQRFVAEDPIGFDAGDVNLYAYTFNNPVNLTDPTGEFVPQLIGCAIGGGVAYALGGRKVEIAAGCVLGAIGIPPMWRAMGAVALSACARFPRSCLGVVSVTAGLAGVSAPPGPVPSTIHGASRIAGPLATRGGVLSAEEIAAVRASEAQRIMTQPDGAIVRIVETTNGRFNVVIDGLGGYITSFRTISQGALDRLAKRYGWQ